MNFILNYYFEVPEEVARANHFFFYELIIL